MKLAIFGVQQRGKLTDSDPPYKMLVNSGFYWSQGQIFNEIFNGFSSRLLSGTGRSRTTESSRPRQTISVHWELDLREAREDKRAWNPVARSLQQGILETRRARRRQDWLGENEAGGGNLRTIATEVTPGFFAARHRPVSAANFIPLPDVATRLGMDGAVVSWLQDRQQPPVALDRSSTSVRPSWKGWRECNSP